MASSSNASTTQLEWDQVITMATMSLSPIAATAGRIVGHRRAHSSGVDIQVSNVDEIQEKSATQPLLDDERFDETLPLPRQRRTYIVLPWIASLLLTSFITYLLTTARQQGGVSGSFNDGFSTELRP